MFRRLPVELALTNVGTLTGDEYLDGITTWDLAAHIYTSIRTINTTDKDQKAAETMSMNISDVPAAPIHNTDGRPWWYRWDPTQVYLTDETVDESWKICTLNGVYFSSQEYSGNTGGRISSIFVILVTSLIVTVFPVLATRIKWLRIHKTIYVVAKNFGTGVIIATAFIHLMDPAYAAIGPQSCVGSTGNWSKYSFAPAIMLAGATITFLIDTYSDFFAQRWRENRGIFAHGHSHNVDDLILGENRNETPGGQIEAVSPSLSRDEANSTQDKGGDVSEDTVSQNSDLFDFYSQIYGFMILEFGIIFHSVMIGLTLGTSDEYATLYVVLVFHQAFEGLGIGARLSMIPFPESKKYLPYLFCLGYALATPISIAIGLGVRYTYRDDGYTAQVVSGSLDSISAGILLYTGFVELLARDFIFNPKRTRSVWDLTFQLFALLWGAGLMAMLGKWA